MAYNDEVAKAYAKVFEGNAPTWNRIAQLVSHHVCDHSATTILDLASGPGEPATTLARAFPRSCITSTDVEADMVELSRKRGSGLSNIEFAVACAENLTGFEDCSFDAVTINQGLQFVSDHVQSLQEIARVLKPGGCAVIVVWKDLQFLPPLQAMMIEILGDPNAPYPKGPVALSSPNAIEDLLTNVHSLRVDHSEEMSINFDLGSEEPEAFLRGALAFPLISDELHRLESNGRVGVKEEARLIWLREMKMRGWFTFDRGFVIPNCRAQVLVLSKQVGGRKRTAPSE